MGSLICFFHFLLYFLQYQVASSSSSSFSLSSFSSSTHPLCHHDQRSALLQFKHMFTINNSSSSSCDDYGIPSYPKTLNWNENNATDCCNWDGVTCDRSTGHVIGLDLSCSQLYGPIHPNSSIFQLSKLQRLNLAYNDFNDSPIPYAIGKLASLTHLNLSYSSYSGSIPSEISHLSKLISLDLSTDENPRLEPNPLRMLLKNLTRLQELVLDQVNIYSVLPGSLADISSLTYLSLTYCELRGSIPKSLGNLTQLTVLFLNGNDFNGEVPSTLSNLKQLAVLGLSFNKLEGKIPDVLGELTMLHYLNLGSNNFKGGFPSWVVNLTKLVVLALYDNQLTGPISSNLCGLQNLTSLNLESNDFSGFVDLQKLKNLEILSLSNTNVSVITSRNSNITLPNLRFFLMSSRKMEVFPDFLRTSKNLVNLDLSDNKIHGLVPDWVGFMGKTSLLYLNLSHNLLTHIKQFPWENLIIVDLHSNLLQGPLPVPPTTIQYFSISNNFLSGEIPLPICNASSLEILDLSHNKLSGEIPPCLAYSSRVLSVLDLHSNRFQGSIPFMFSKPNKVRNLDLNRNQLEGPLPRSLINCKSLEVLDVGNNKINDTFPNWLETLPELQVLVLQLNRFHGPVHAPTSKFPFSKLRIVDLSYNGFNGHLPARYFKHLTAMKNNTMADKKYMGDENYFYYDSVTMTIKGILTKVDRIFTIFTTIDFSSNNFSGEIPKAVGGLDSLRELNLSHNSLSGHISEFLGNLKNLESLDLSSNKFFGKIPTQLTKLTFLEVLNLSWNNLHGPIPWGSQFNTFGTGSYDGNSGLCGFPLPKECGNNLTQVQPPPELQKSEDDSDFDGFTWKIVMIGYECGLPLGLFLGFLMFLFGRPKFIVSLFEGKKPEKVKRLRRTDRRN